MLSHKSWESSVFRLLAGIFLGAPEATDHADESTLSKCDEEKWQIVSTYCEEMRDFLTPAPCSSLWADAFPFPTPPQPASPSASLHSSSRRGRKTRSRCQGSPCGRWSVEGIHNGRSGREWEIKTWRNQRIKRPERPLWLPIKSLWCWQLIGIKDTDDSAGCILGLVWPLWTHEGSFLLLF